MLDPMIAALDAFCARLRLVLIAAYAASSISLVLLALCPWLPQIGSIALILAMAGLSLGGLATYWSITIDWPTRLLSLAPAVLSLAAAGIDLHLRNSG